MKKMFEFFVTHYDAFLQSLAVFAILFAGYACWLVVFGMDSVLTEDPHNAVDIILHHTYAAFVGSSICAIVTFIIVIMNVGKKGEEDE